MPYDQLGRVGQELAVPQKQHDDEILDVHFDLGRALELILSHELISSPRPVLKKFASAKLAPNVLYSGGLQG